VPATEALAEEERVVRELAFEAASAFGSDLGQTVPSERAALELAVALRAAAIALEWDFDLTVEPADLLERRSQRGGLPP
jgi:hypothetical protein